MSLILTMLAMIIISFIALHFWVFIWDCIIGGFKKLFHIGKKENINWHSLNKETKKVSKDKVEKTKEVVQDNERLY